MFNFSRDQRIGHEGERWVYRQLQKHGYHPALDPDWLAQGYDMVVSGLPVEVKFARKTYRRRKNARGFYIDYDRWQWFIHDTSLQQQDWILILVAEDDKGDRYPFVLPGSVVGERNQVQLTSHPTQYSGWLKKWLGRWDVIDYIAKQTYQNGGPLFHELGQAA